MQKIDFRTLLHQEIDLLTSQNLTKAFGLISNLKNQSKEEDVWLNTSKSELKKILEGLTDLENGKTIPHIVVIDKMRDKVTNA